MDALYESAKNVGFVSTRFFGTDGVSLETEKWANVLKSLGWRCFYFAGELDRPPQVSYFLPEAHFKHPEIRRCFHSCFGVDVRPRKTTALVHRLAQHIKKHLYEFIRQFQVDLIVAENSLTIPLNIPLGVALSELVMETGMRIIAHHHDFFWERQHFLTNAAWDYLNMAFPPHLPHIRHVVINSSADNQLSLRTGISSTVIPNVMDFENPPPPPDEYASDVREALGVEDDEYLLLQPTRVVKRKGIEHAIELASLLGAKAKLVISHASGDEGYDYERRVREYSKRMNVKTVFVSEIINHTRGYTKDGRKVYTLFDIYPHADLVTYPSTIEGFGNAFLETVYFRRPIMINLYSIYAWDIKPKGFKAIEIDGYVNGKTVRQTREILENPELAREMTETNYEIASRHYSYKVLRRKLMNLLLD